MKLLRLLNQRATYTAVTLAFLLVAVSPVLVPSFASADGISSQSIDLSSSAAAATGVTYDVQFTVSAAGAGAFVVDFCDNSPVVKTTCDAPTGFSTAGVTTSTVGASVTPLSGDTGVVVTDTVAGSATANVVLAGITNPTSPTDDTTDNGFYGRIVTYDTEPHAAAYTDTALGTGARDYGGVAMSITNAIGVSATVPETMTFCVASATITANCANAASNLPNVVLGVSSGTGAALSPTVLSTGNIYTQISTNAQSGGQISLKSSATSCGGLVRTGAPSSCDIGPAPGGGFAAGTADFGVETATASATSGVTDAAGTLEPVSGSGYNASTYYMHYVAGNGTGVTSTYGDPFLDTDSLPDNNQNMELTFGASISNNTPAGSYSADLGMIASGTY
jgi:hypothetical protein